MKSKYQIIPLFMDLDDYTNSKGVLYQEIKMVFITFKTDNKVLTKLLAPGFKTYDDTSVTMFFCESTGVEFMAGAGYRIAALNTNVEYQGKQDVVRGNYSLVMFENATMPILLGRELLGVPKLYADISPIYHHSDNSVRWETSIFGHLLFGLTVANFTAQNQSVVDNANTKPGMPLLGYKNIPSPEGEALCYATATPTDAKISQIYVGENPQLYFGDPTHQNIGFLVSIIDKLKQLPILEITGAKMIITTETLRIDQTRMLK